MLRYAWRLFKRLFLLTLPFTFFPIFAGSLAGIVFSFWHQKHIDSTTDKFLYEVKDAAFDWGFGFNTPTRRGYQDYSNNFHIARVNSNDWNSKLSLLLPNEYIDFDQNENVPVDKFADLDALVQNPMCMDTCPKQQWLYLTETAKPSTNEWDAAFDEAIQQAYAHPTLGQHGFLFANCNGTAGFLCGVWATRAPALVHFVVEEEPIAGDDIRRSLTYDQEVEDLRSVTARIIELPLEDAYTGLPAHVFPNHKEQLLSIISDKNMYEQFEPYSAAIQTITRFSEYLDSLYDDSGSILYYINIVDNWLMEHAAKPLEMEKLMYSLHAMAFTIFGGITSNLVLVPISLVKLIVKDFLGEPRRGDAILGDLDDQGQKPGFWDGLEDEAWTASLSRKAESEKQEFNDWMKTLMASSSTDSEAAGATTTEPSQSVQSTPAEALVEAPAKQTPSL